MQDEVKSSRIDLASMSSEEYMKLLESASAEELALIVESFDQEMVKVKSKKQVPFLEKVLAIPEEPRSIVSVIAWWESRRVLYNVLVGLAGAPMVLLMMVLSTHSFWFILSGSIVYGVLANFCYTLGWMAELVARAAFGKQAANTAPILFTLGTVFSIVITFAISVLYLLTVGF